MPTALTNGVNAIHIGEKHDFGVYTGKLIGTASELRASIYKAANWVFSEDTAYNLWSFNKDVANTAGNIGVTGTLNLSKSSLNKFTMYPNPASEYVTLNFGEIQNKLQIEVFTTLGKSVKKVIENNVRNLKLDFSNLSTGVYFISITSEKTTQTKKIIIK